MLKTKNREQKLVVIAAVVLSSIPLAGCFETTGLGILRHAPDDRILKRPGGLPAYVVPPSAVEDRDDQDHRRCLFASAFRLCRS
jgi:hypothetical protein